LNRFLSKAREPPQPTRQSALAGGAMLARLQTQAALPNRMAITASRPGGPKPGDPKTGNP